MYKNRVSRNFDWIKQDDGKYTKQNRLETYDSNRFISVDDIYFKFNKYLTGITYTYVNNLDDIYSKNILTGDGYSIINMYNEYDVIDRVMKNISLVDVASDTNIDIYSQWLQINGVKLKPGHLVLLKNQDLDIENDIYVVTNKNFLINSDLLNNREKSDKFSCSIKIGNNFDKQFFLLNSGNTFPITGEPKQFVEGKSFILKNLVKYDLNSTYTNYNNAAKILFTDYDVARKQLNENSEIYDNINIDIDRTYFSPELIKIDYRHEPTYIIKSGTTENSYFSGITSTITNKVLNTFTLIPYDILTFNCSDGDYIKLDIYSGSTFNSATTVLLTLDVFIKDLVVINSVNYIILDEILPNRILNSLKTYAFSVNNLNIATDWDDVFYKLNHTPYSEYYSIVNRDFNVDFIEVIVKAIINEYDKYFDYDALIFSFNDNNNWFTSGFTSKNQYISYKLYDNLNKLDDIILNSGYTFYNEYLLTGFTYEYTDNNRIRIVDNSESLLSNFKPYTYVNISGVTLSGRTLIYSVNEHEMIIEKPSSFPFFPATQLVSIQNIDGLKNISDILYEVYMNDTYDWYIKKIDNERKYICRSYAEILVMDEYIRLLATGVLFENENNEFILKLFNLGSNVNVDELLYFSTIELIYIGSDRKSRFPVPLTVLSSIGTNSYYILVGGLNDSLETFGGVTNGGLNIVYPGHTDPLLYYYNIINSGLNSI